MPPPAARIRPLPSAYILISFLLGVVVLPVAAQLTCFTNDPSNSTDPSPPWWYNLDNSNHSDPCQVAQRLRSTLCNKPSATELLHPPSEDCICIWQAYDLWGACAACQLYSPFNATPFPSFASWSQNCNASDGTLDPDTAAILPKWVTVVGGNAKNSIVPNFNLTMALDTAALDPASNSPTANASPAGTLIGPTQSVPTVNTGSSLSGSGKSSNVGPIVGGVLGGVLLIALSTLLTLFYRRRERQKRVAPSSEFTKYLQQPTLRRPPSQQEYKDVPEVAAVAPHIEEAPEYQRPADPDVEELPGFTPGHYAGPIFEKGGYVADPNSPVHSSPTTHGSSSHPQN